MLAVDTGVIKKAVSSKRWRDVVSQISGCKCTLWLWALPQTCTDGSTGMQSNFCDALLIDGDAYATVAL